jgi:hypothetical protein
MNIIKDCYYHTYTGYLNGYIIEIELQKDQDDSITQDLEKKVKKIILQLFNKYKELDKNDRLGSLRAIYNPEKKILQLWKNTPFASFWKGGQSGKSIEAYKYIIDYFYKEISISDDLPFLSRYLEVEAILLDSWDELNG